MQDKPLIRIYRDGDLAVLPTFSNYAAHYLRTRVPAATEQVKQGMKAEHKATAYTLAGMLAVALFNIIAA